jgi:hypothetical protein
MTTRPDFAPRGRTRWFESYLDTVQWRSLTRRRARRRILHKLHKYPKLSRVSWGDEIDRASLLADGVTGPGRLYALERHFWLDLWRVPPLEAVEEGGLETRRYGPVRVLVLPEAPRTPLFNLVLGAESPGAVTRGRLAAALDWTESLGVDCRVSVRPEFGEPDAAEDHLIERRYRPSAVQALFVRNPVPPDLPEPAGVEVEELTEETEGFSHHLATNYGMEWTGYGIFIGLPGRDRWRSYTAHDAGNGDEIGAATMMLHDEKVAQLGFAAVSKRARRRGAHAALLRRRIVDALAAGSRLLFAVTEEPLDYPEVRSTGAGNLVRAGFGLVAARTVWRPPADLLAGGEDEDEDDFEDEDWPDGGDSEDDHEFELEG